MHILLQNAMLLIAVLLLVVSFIPGMITATHTVADGAVITQKYSFYTALSVGAILGLPWFLLTLTMCAGAIAFRVTQAGKPLDWTLGSAVFGIAACVLAMLSQAETHVYISVVVLVLFLLELLLTSIYKIGRHFSFFT